MSTTPDPQISYVPNESIPETFADSVRELSFDGQTMRIELCTTRVDPLQATQKQYPVCRLVLTPNCGIDLFNKLQQILKVLEKSGVVKRNLPIQSAPSTVQ